MTVDPSTPLAYANIVNKVAPYTDKRFRQGLAMCLDLDGIKQLVYADRGTPTNNFMPSLSWAYVDIPNYPFDPDKAKALFAAAGVPSGFKTTILAIEGYPDLIAIAPIWQDGLKKAGIDCAMKPSRSTTGWTASAMATTRFRSTSTSTAPIRSACSRPTSSTTSSRRNGPTRI